MELLVNNLVTILVVLFSIKLLTSNFSIIDALGALIVLSTLLLKHVVDYMFPKREDIFEALKVLNEKISKLDDIESDVTALKFGALRK